MNPIGRLPKRFASPSCRFSTQGVLALAVFFIGHSKKRFKRLLPQPPTSQRA